MKLLITGGTVFVSRAAAEYFCARGDEVCVLNRGSRPQPDGVTPIICDRHAIGDRLKSHRFDAVIDVCAYNRGDIEALLNALGDFGEYIFISSSAVYPETLPQPFNEGQRCGRNTVWGDYGADKLAAEEYLTERVPGAYILRPPYLYGRGENVYRAPFIFDCAEADESVFVPREDLRLQFFNVSDLCRFIGVILEKKPAERLFNVGNPETVTVSQWVQMCFDAAGKIPQIKTVPKEYYVRNYFCFYDYDYKLDVSRMTELMPDVMPLKEGIRQEYKWYKNDPGAVAKRDYFKYIKESLQKL